jgi:plastocyanin
MTADCQHGQAGTPLAETVLANPDGTLRNVVVSIKRGLGARTFAPPTAPALLDQKGCVYIPHVLAVQSNQIITILNSDPTLHNVHAVTKINDAFNVGMAVLGQRISRYFSKPEVVKMKCDVHSWMSSYVAVFEHPFHAVTGDGGGFEIRGLPAGEYEVEGWHETYGSLTEQVRIAEGESRTIELRFGG